MQHYIIAGCDLHDANALLRVAFDREEPVTRVFRNTAEGRGRMTAWLKKLSAEHGDATIVFAYEASALGFGLYDELTARGIRCHVLAPTRLNSSPKQRRRKTDQKDAQKILEVLRGHLLAGNELPAVWIPDPETRDNRELVRMRLWVGEELTRVKARIKMLLKRNGIAPEPGTKRWNKQYRIWLGWMADEEETELRAGACAALGSLMRQLEMLEREQKQLDAQLERLGKSARYRRAVQELCRICGVGLLTALVFLTEVGDPRRFANRRQIGSFLGLVPASDESGEVTDRKGHITRQGSARLRKVLCQAVWAGLRGDGPETPWWRQYVAQRPTRRKIATVAAMRRLGVRLWHRACDAWEPAETTASLPDSAGGPCPRAGALIAAPCTPG